MSLPGLSRCESDRCESDSDNIRVFSSPFERISRPDRHRHRARCRRGRTRSGCHLAVPGRIHPWSSRTRRLERSRVRGRGRPVPCNWNDPVYRTLVIALTQRPHRPVHPPLASTRSLIECRRAVVHLRVRLRYAKPRFVGIRCLTVAPLIHEKHRKGLAPYGPPWGEHALVRRVARKLHPQKCNRVTSHDFVCRLVRGVRWIIAVQTGELSLNLRRRTKADVSAKQHH